MSISVNRVVALAVSTGAFVLIATTAYVGLDLRAAAAAAASGALTGEAAAQRLRVAGANLILLNVTFLGLMILLAVHAAGLVVQPLADLTRRVTLVGQGQFGERAVADGPRETRDLASAVNGMAASLAWREQRLLHAERLSTVGTLVAGVAHEINNPLTFLRVNEHVLHGDALARAGRADLPGDERERAKKQARMHERNIDGLRRLSDISAALRDVGRAPQPDRRPHDVNRLVSGCLILAHHHLKDGHKVERDLAATRPILCDGGEVSQVVLNLLLNAAEAMRDGGCIAVSTADEGDEVVVRVTDDGPGVPEAFRARLFQPFATTKPHGTGLGLAISRQIVESHGGRIACETQTGKGATFTVRLPAAPPAPAHSPATALPRDSPAG